VVPKGDNIQIRLIVTWNMSSVVVGFLSYVEATNISYLHFTVAFLVLSLFSGTIFGLLFCLLLSYSAALLLRAILNKPITVNQTQDAVLVTGASSGIGKDAALALAVKGVTVFAGVRKEKDAEALRHIAKTLNVDEGKLIPVILDVTNQEQIAQVRALVEKELVSSNKRLIGLVNNAGYGESGPVEIISLEKWRYQYEVNLFGQIAVTQAFLPLLRKAATKSRSSRILMVTSAVGRFTIPSIGAYSSTKYALESVSDALRMELASWNIDVAIIEPGAIETDFMNAAKGKAEETFKHILEKSSDDGDEVIKRYQMFREKQASPVTKGGSVVLSSNKIAKALFDSKPLARYTCGHDALAVLNIFGFIPSEQKDRMFGSLWKSV
jgi:NAD(P)-dependent dehydrogenase (short-subunit alcohol dehydrogenase family)